MKAVVAVICLLLALAAPIVFAGPQLLADMRAGPVWEDAFDLHVTGAHCTRWEALVSTCSIDYSGLTRAEVMPQLHYLVFGSWAGEQTMLVRSSANPAVVTTVQGVRDLPAREITLGAWIVFVALVIFSFGGAIVRKSRAEPPIPDSAGLPQPARGTTQPVTAARHAFGRRGL